MNSRDPMEGESATGTLGGNDSSAKRVGPCLGDFDIGETVDEMRRPGKVDPAIVFGASSELGIVFARGSLDENPLHRTHQRGAARAGILLEERLQSGESGLFLFVRHFVGE